MILTFKQAKKAAVVRRVYGTGRGGPNENAGEQVGPIKRVKGRKGHRTSASAIAISLDEDTGKLMVSRRK